MRAVICGYYGRGNGGDEALLLSLLQMLPADVQPLVLSAKPKETSQSYGVLSCHHRSAFDILKVLQKSDYFIWGGGSLMQDVTSLASPIYYSGLMAWAQQLNLKTIAWAQGIGPLRHPLSIWLTQQVLKSCSAVSVRDEASAQLVAQWGIKPLIAPDPVWALESKAANGLLRDLPKPIVAVNFRAHPLLTPKKLHNLIQALVAFQQQTRSSILLLPFQKTQDYAIATTIAQYLPGYHQIRLIKNPQTLKGLFQEVAMVIGMRYHSLIMGAAAGCRCFALSYDPKVTQLQRQIDIPGWELAELSEDSNSISNAWLQAYTRGKSLNMAQIRSIITQALKHQDLLRETLLKE